MGFDMSFTVHSTIVMNYHSWLEACRELAFGPNSHVLSRAFSPKSFNSTSGNFRSRFTEEQTQELINVHDELYSAKNWKRMAYDDIQKGADQHKLKRATLLCNWFMAWVTNLYLKPGSKDVVTSHGGVSSRREVQVDIQFEQIVDIDLWQKFVTVIFKHYNKQWDLSKYSRQGQP